ncbi:MBL fold metallo-hydrolase [Methanobacterium sp.]|uniref:MBL fold metallo-hydrolase n=1 Tax=Methanobacterium sp. TaxID=2164 RepID=UPI0025D46C0E|nr:MBL fold metallo-hydrolase [Methanobacterium sp.]MBI5459521.1 MBL fold metallo-hydrolase [Methanobacterium sp.]
MQITEHIHAIKIPFQVKTNSGILERFVYSYLIYGDDVCLIDSGVSSSEKVIFDYLEKTGHAPDDISLMILTHSHPDHIGSAKSIQRISGCEIAAHCGEKSWIEDVDLQFKERPVPNFHSLVEGSVQVDIVLEAGEVVDLGGNIQLEVIHTPGHSAGSISLHIPPERVLITGDAVPLPGDLPIYGDFAKSVMSIERLKAVKGLEVLLASWDEPQKGDDIHQRMDEALDYLQHIQEVVEKLAPVNSPADSMEFCRIVLKELGLPEPAANPIVARSFQANLKDLGEKD